MARLDRGTLATLLAALIWGLSFVVNDVGLAFVGPLTFASSRFLLAGALVLPVLAWRGRLRSGRLLRSPWLWGLAVVSAATYVLQYESQTITTPARAALFGNFGILAVPLMERALFRERLGVARVAALVVGVLGATLLVAGRDLGSGTLVGDLLAVGSGVAWGLYIVLNRKTLHDEDPVSVVAWTFALTGLLLAPGMLLPGGGAPTGALGWAAIAYSALFSTTLAYALFAYGQRTLTATTSAVLILFEILVASTLSLAIGRETFGVLDLLGAALMVGAIVAVSAIPSPASESAPRS